jgi:F-type H+-transporting ATPase subunit gamma
MQMIAASKMRRAQERVTAARPYARKIRQVIAGLTQMNPAGDDGVHPLLEQRPVERVLVVHVTPDRGLAGGLPTNMNRETAQRLLRSDTPVSVITVGRKGRDFFTRTGADVIADYSGMSDRPTMADCIPIVRQVETMYRTAQVDEVYLAYTVYVNTLVQTPVVQRLLPVDPAELGEAALMTDSLFEPSAPELLGALLPRFLEAQLYYSMLEAQASEQSARMVAMRNATDAADDMIDALTLEMNKVRQESITNELLDLVGGVAALEG